jgi:hypothetical protein
MQPPYLLAAQAHRRESQNCRFECRWKASRHTTQRPRCIDTGRATIETQALKKIVVGMLQPERCRHNGTRFHKAVITVFVASHLTGNDPVSIAPEN